MCDREVNFDSFQSALSKWICNIIIAVISSAVFVFLFFFPVTMVSVSFLQILCALDIAQHASGVRVQSLHILWRRCKLWTNESYCCVLSGFIEISTLRSKYVFMLLYSLLIALNYDKRSKHRSPSNLFSNYNVCVCTHVMSQKAKYNVIQREFRDKKCEGKHSGVFLIEWYLFKYGLWPC